jgi:hypothetical protein
VPAVGYGSLSYIDASSVDNTSGNLEIGDSSTLTISGTYSQGSLGTFTPQLDGTLTGSTYGQLTASGGSTLAGTLDIDTISGFAPTASNTFEVIKGGTVSGTFGTILGKYPSGNNTAYGVTYDSAVTVSVDATRAVNTVAPLQLLPGIIVNTGGRGGRGRYMSTSGSCRASPTAATTSSSSRCTAMGARSAHSVRRRRLLPRTTGTARLFKCSRTPTGRATRPSAGIPTRQSWTTPTSRRSSPGSLRPSRDPPRPASTSAHTESAERSRRPCVSCPGARASSLGI